MRLFRRLQYLLHRNRREEELAEELAFHRTLAEREQRDSGIAPEMARCAVSRQMGNTTLAREAAHYIWFPAAVNISTRDFIDRQSPLLRHGDGPALGGSNRCAAAVRSFFRPGPQLNQVPVDGVDALIIPRDRTLEGGFGMHR